MASIDAQIVKDASHVSEEYALICALALRQAFATVELTYTKRDGIQAWVKEISSDGNLNTVDIIYPAMPMFLYLCPKWIGWMIQPILEYQSKGPTYSSCAHDLGNHYPYATGPSDGSDSHMPVEESGNILIIALAHAQATRDTSLIERYYHLFELWAAYLMRKGLIPELKLSTDGKEAHCNTRLPRPYIYAFLRLHGTRQQPVFARIERWNWYWGNGRDGSPCWTDINDL